MQLRAHSTLLTSQPPPTPTDTLGTLRSDHITAIPCANRPAGHTLHSDHITTTTVPTHRLARYVKGSNSIGYRERLVVLSWLFVPPIEADPDAVDCAHSNSSFVVVPRAPPEWSDPSSVYADMILMTLVSVCRPLPF